MFVFYFGITELTTNCNCFFFFQNKGARGTLSEGALCVVETKLVK